MSCLAMSRHTTCRKRQTIETENPSLKTVNPLKGLSSNIAEEYGVTLVSRPNLCFLDQFSRWTSKLPS